MNLVEYLRIIVNQGVDTVVDPRLLGVSPLERVNQLRAGIAKNQPNVLEGDEHAGPNHSQPVVDAGSPSFTHMDSDSELDSCKDATPHKDVGIVSGPNSLIQHYLHLHADNSDSESDDDDDPSLNSVGGSTLPSGKSSHEEGEECGTDGGNITPRLACGISSARPKPLTDGDKKYYIQVFKQIMVDEETARQKRMDSAGLKSQLPSVGYMDMMSGMPPALAATDLEATNRLGSRHPKHTKDFVTHLQEAYHAKSNNVPGASNASGGARARAKHPVPLDTRKGNALDAVKRALVGLKNYLEDKSAEDPHEQGALFMIQLAILVNLGERLLQIANGKKANSPLLRVTKEASIHIRSLSSSAYRTMAKYFPCLLSEGECRRAALDFSQAASPLDCVNVASIGKYAGVVHKLMHTIRVGTRASESVIQSPTAMVLKTDETGCLSTFALDQNNRGEHGIAKSSLTRALALSEDLVKALENEDDTRSRVSGDELGARQDAFSKRLVEQQSLWVINPLLMGAIGNKFAQIVAMFGTTVNASAADILGERGIVEAILGIAGFIVPAEVGDGAAKNSKAWDALLKYPPLYAPELGDIPQEVDSRIGGKAWFPSQIYPFLPVTCIKDAPHAAKCDINALGNKEIYLPYREPGAPNDILLLVDVKVIEKYVMDFMAVSKHCSMSPAKVREILGRFAGSKQKMNFANAAGFVSKRFMRLLKDCVAALNPSPNDPKHKIFVESVKAHTRFAELMDVWVDSFNSRGNKFGRGKGRSTKVSVSADLSLGILNNHLRAPGRYLQEAFEACRREKGLNTQRNSFSPVTIENTWASGANSASLAIAITMHIFPGCSVCIASLLNCIIEMVNAELKRPAPPGGFTAETAIQFQHRANMRRLLHFASRAMTAFLPESGLGGCRVNSIARRSSYLDAMVGGGRNMNAAGYVKDNEGSDDDSFDTGHNADDAPSSGNVETEKGWSSEVVRVHKHNAVTGHSKHTVLAFVVSGEACLG
jgi:hypothetical protein